MSRKLRPIRIEGDLAFVPLTKGYEAIIDAADVPLVKEWTWWARVDCRRDGAVRSVYAKRIDFTLEKPRSVYLHRLIMGDPTGLLIDHIDGNGLNNTRANLRSATHAQNARNTRRSAHNTSGFKGVKWHKGAGKWEATIRVDNKRHYLGLFACTTSARMAYAAASHKQHREFGRVS